MAQQKDSSAKAIIEKGSKGDLILGKENQQKQLQNAPQLLEMKNADAAPSPKRSTSATATSKKKKTATINCRKKN